MLGEKFRGKVEGITRPVGRTLARAGLSPDLLTLAGLAFSLLAGGLGAAAMYRQAGVALLAGGVMDLLDGPVARVTGRAGKTGAFLDSVCDRVGEGAVLTGLAWSLRGEPSGLAAALAALVFGYLVSYAKARGESLGVEVPGGLMERAERIILLSLGLFLGWLPVFLWALALLSGATALYRARAVLRSGGA